MKSSSSIFHNFKLKTNSSPINNSNNNSGGGAQINANTPQNDARKMSKLFDAKSSKSATNIFNKTDNLRPSLPLSSNSQIFRQQQQKEDTPISYLSDSQNNKIGSIYQVGYLGSAILTKGKTGLGCLQQPLRELYSIYRQQGSRLLQERRFFVSLDGITMLFNELGVEKCVHNDLSSVYDVQLLKLVSEQRKDKKTYCAFLPFGNFIYFFLGGGGRGVSFKVAFNRLFGDW
jgi:hypothetical protein